MRARDGQARRFLGDAARGPRTDGSGAAGGWPACPRAGADAGAGDVRAGVEGAARLARRGALARRARGAPAPAAPGAPVVGIPGVEARRRGSRAVRLAGAARDAFGLAAAASCAPRAAAGGRGDARDALGARVCPGGLAV